MIKVCGITNSRDARAAAAAGADLLGFIFYGRSPRFIKPVRAGEIIAQVRQEWPAVAMVGVFVNESPARTAEIADACGLDLIQLHGGETPEIVQELGPRAFKALRPRDWTEAHELFELYRGVVEARSPALLLDAYHPSAFGGTGDRADWEIGREFARSLPILLAGGLTAGNVAEAIQSVRPWGVDVSSGVEREPGIKDHDRLVQFVAAARNAFASIRAESRTTGGTI